MAPKIRLTARVLRPPEQPITFLLPVESDITFERVWQLAYQRFLQNYTAGRRGTHFWKKIQDSSGADIDLRDTVIDIFGPIDDPQQHIVHFQQLPHGRDDTAPADSHLHPPIAPRTPAELQELDRERAEFARYGATLVNLDPDQPVESHEQRTEPQRDSDGFAIPAKIARPPAAQHPIVTQAAQNPQTISQDTYEDQLVRSQPHISPELGSPAVPAPTVTRHETPPSQANTANTPTQYSTFDAVPSAQKPPAVIHPANDQMDVDVDLADPISEESQPRLSSSMNRTPAQSSSSKRKSLDAGETSALRLQNQQGVWSPQEIDKMIDGLARGLNSHDIHQGYFPQRSWESVRKKATATKKKDAAAITQRKSALSAPPTWTEDEEAYFVKAIRKNQAWKTLRDHRFRDRSDNTVMVHYAEVRQRLEAEDKANSAVKQYHEQLQQGQPSTGPNEKFTQDEDDFLLACRIEQVEMKRAAKEFFPLRPTEQVTNRAGTLYHKAKRAAAKSHSVNLERSPSVEFLFENDAAARDRIERKRVLAREFKIKSNLDRTRESNESSQRKSKLQDDRERTEVRREKEADQLSYHSSLAKAQQHDERVKLRRLNDDLRRESQYGQEFAAWEKQTALDKENGRPTQPPPERPRGSGIGTEVLTTQPPSVKKRRVSDVEVQIVLPSSSKKQKTAGKLKSVATPARQPQGTKAKAASTSKLKSVSTPRPAAKSSLPKAASTRKRSSTHGQKPQSFPVKEDDEPIITFTSFPATQPAAATSSKKAAKDSALQTLSRPALSTVKSLRQSKLPFVSSTPTAKSAPASGTPQVDDSAFISSDEELLYDDKDITDEELNAVAERSEAMYNSSPTKSADTAVTQSNVNLQQVEMSPEKLAMRSSPPLTSVTTPNARSLHHKSDADEAKTPRADSPRKQSSQTTSTPGGTGSHGHQNQLRDELIKSTQTIEAAMPESNTMIDNTSKDHTSDFDAPTVQSFDSGTKGVEEINCWRSESGHSEVEEDWPTEKSSDDEMPFSKRDKFGFTIPPATRSPIAATAPSSRASYPASAPKERSIGEQVADVFRSPSVNNLAPPFPSSGKVKSQSSIDSPGDPTRPFSSPTARFSGRSSDTDSQKKKSRRHGMGRLRKSKSGANRTDDAHLFAAPSTAPPKMLSEPLSRQSGKQPVKNGKVGSKRLDDAMDKMIKASQTASPVETVSKKSVPTVKSISGRVVNSAVFGDAVAESREARRLADERMCDLLRMPPEEFYHPNNMKRVNEDQIAAYMIEQGVRRSMREREMNNATFSNAAFLPRPTGRVLGSATQPNAAFSPQARRGVPQSATQPAVITNNGMASKRRVSLSSDTSDEDSDSEEEDAIASLEKLSKRADNAKKRDVSCLPHW